jgi:hypothetical protein
MVVFNQLTCVVVDKNQVLRSSFLFLQNISAQAPKSLDSCLVEDRM